MALNLLSFEPGTYIELDDTMGGFRKLGLVIEGGDMYVDEAGDTWTPFPIYAALDPVAVGNPLCWGLELAAKRPAGSGPFALLQERLAAAGVDAITAGRALFWAFRNRTYDYGRALAAGEAASAQVTNSRATMDRIISRAAA